MLNDSMFKQHIKSLEITDASQIPTKEPGEKENKPKRICRISSDFSCVVSGLKCFLNETASDLVSHLLEDFFNLDAKPFIPKQAATTTPAQFSALGSTAKKETPVVDQE